MLALTIGGQGPYSTPQKESLSNGDILTSARTAGKETLAAVTNGAPHGVQDTELQTIPNSPRSTAPSNAVAGPSNWSAASLPDRLHLEDSQTSFIDVTRYVFDVSQHPVAHSGFCDVHTGQMENVGMVALKKLRILGSLEKCKKRFRYEAEIWFRLDHPNVLRFLGIYQDGPIMHMASPWQCNGHMTAYLGAHPDADRFMLLTQVADALAYLHDYDPQIIHGDIKGANILISDQGDALLCDFGLSMVLAEIAFMSGRPTEVNHGGTHRFMAPELMVGDASKTEASDTYAFAMLIIEAFTNEPPFRQYKTQLAVVVAVTKGKRPTRSLVHLPRGTENDRLWRLMELCWHATPAVRPKMDHIKELLNWIHEEHESDPGTEVVSTNLRDVVDGNITVADYTKLIRRRRRWPTLIRNPETRRSITVLLPNLLIDFVIVVVSASQIGLTAALISDLSDPGKADGIIGRILIPLGFSTNIWINAIWYPAEIVIYGGFMFPETRWLNTASHRTISRLRLPLLSLIWMLSAADATAISVLSRAKRFHHISTGRLASLLRAYEILAWFLCFCTTMFGVRGFYFWLYLRRATPRYPLETAATPEVEQAAGKQRAKMGGGMLKFGQRKKTSPPSRHEGDQASLPVSRIRVSGDSGRDLPAPAIQHVRDPSLRDDGSIRVPVLDTSDSEWNLPAPAEQDVRTPPPRDDTNAKDPVLDDADIKGAVSDNPNSPGAMSAAPLSTPVEERQIRTTSGHTDGGDDERFMTARQKEKQAVRT